MFRNIPRITYQKSPGIHLWAIITDTYYNMVLRTERAKKIFSDFDKDGSGFLDKSEVEAFVKKAKGCPDALARVVAEKVIKIADLNLDGKISKGELIAFLS